MSGDTPRWLQELEQELGLDNTPASEAPDNEISILDAVKHIEFTPEGWARVRAIILRADKTADPELLRRIMVKDDSDSMLFIAMIALPYQLTKALGYAPKSCEKLITYITASYVIALSKGYELGQEDAEAV